MNVKFDIAMDDKGTVELSDDVFDIIGWVELRLTRLDEHGTTDEKMTVEVHIDELYRACLPFMDKWQRERSES